ncbi:MAG: hypothetical protein Q7T73_22545 [Beijerinckiaceae bacterium]|nr:hypothetical protein [Beijerinckiaceae bacterium]
MSEIDRIAQAKFKDERAAAAESRIAGNTARTQQAVSAERRLQRAIDRALTEFPQTHRESLIPYPVRTKSALFAKKTVLASWVVGTVHRSESSHRVAGSHQVYLLTNGHLVWAPSSNGEHKQIESEGLQGRFSDSERHVIAASIERMLDTI